MKKLKKEQYKRIAEMLADFANVLSSQEFTRSVPTCVIDCYDCYKIEIRNLGSYVYDIYKTMPNEEGGAK